MSGRQPAMYLAKMYSRSSQGLLRWLFFAVCTRAFLRRHGCTSNLTFARATWGRSAVPFVHRCLVSPNTSACDELRAFDVSRIIDPVGASSPLLASNSISCSEP